MTTPAQLDTEELLFLSIKASQNNNHENAISLLKRALELDPNNAKVHYMLGAEHAEIGMYDRASAEMARAVELDPSLVTAQFQLGLLHLTAGRIDDAEHTWHPLDKLGAQHPLYLFKKGMLHLVRDEFVDCKLALEAGIKVNIGNEPLSNDMRRILNDIQPHLPQSDAPASKPTAAGKSRPAYPKNVLLSAYQDKQQRNKTEDDE